MHTEYPVLYCGVWSRKIRGEYKVRWLSRWEAAVLHPAHSPLPAPPGQSSCTANIFDCCETTLPLPLVNRCCQYAAWLALPVQTITMSKPSSSFIRFTLSSMLASAILILVLDSKRSSLKVPTVGIRDLSKTFLKLLRPIKVPSPERNLSTLYGHRDGLFYLSGASTVGTS